MNALDRINCPADLRALSMDELDTLAAEIRQQILHTVSHLGGHLASSLGAVELCLALHHAFEAPKDQLVWDMGYQAFTHKLITGRRDRFHTLKQFGGLSGFCHKDESPYDLFSTGHGGTVLSTALGLALARNHTRGTHHTVAIIGDASLGEGMALEALNHIGHLQTSMLVVLNDNRMSIAKPIGGLSRYLNRIIINPTYNHLREQVKRVLKRLPRGEDLLQFGHKIEESLKGLIVPGLVFEELGFRYLGPTDGHRIPELIKTLTSIKKMTGPILWHVVTTKGKGYGPAEQDPERFHKIESFDVATGQLKLQDSREVGHRQPRASNLEPSATFSEAFSSELVSLGERDPRVVAITAAMPEGTGVNLFAARFPERTIDVGMAEQHAVGLAAGLARGGMRPIFAVYSTFLQRAYDQIMHEMCLQNLPVILAIDRAGLVGEDGPTHHGVFDVAYLRPLPAMTILSPKDPLELQFMLRWALKHDGPVALRYSRGGIVCGTPLGTCANITLGRSECLRSGKDVALLALGSMVYPAFAVAERLAEQGIEATVVNARFAKPIDDVMVRQLAERIGRVVTLEEAQVFGGFGSAVSETLDALGASQTPHLRIGLPDQFIEHGKRSELLQLAQVDPQSLYSRIAVWLQLHPAAPSTSWVPETLP